MGSGSWINFDEAGLELRMIRRKEQTVEGVVRSIPWRIAAGVLLVLGVGAAIFLYVEHRKEEAARQRLLDRQEALVREAGPFLEELSQRVTQLVAQEGREWAGEVVETAFDPGSYVKKNGIYLRLPLAATQDREAIEAAARRQHSDAVAGCLGLNPVLLGRILEEATVLRPAFRESIRQAPDRTRLSALAEDFKVRTDRDLKPLAQHLQATYLLLVLEEPPGADGQLFRVMFWDLQLPGTRPVVRARTENKFALLPVRWVEKNRWPRHASVDQQAENTAADCAIAQAIKPKQLQPPGAMDSGLPLLGPDAPTLGVSPTGSGSANPATAQPTAAPAVESTAHPAPAPPRDGTAGPASAP